MLGHVEHPNQAWDGKTALFVALEAKRTQVVLNMLQIGTFHLVPAGEVAKPEVVEMLRGATQDDDDDDDATQDVLKAFAKSKSVVFGGNLRGQQLWLWCNLMVAVGPNPDTNTLQLNVQRGNDSSMLEGLCAQFGIDETTGEVDAAATAQQLTVWFEGENGVGDGLRREWFHKATVEIVDFGKGLFSSKDDGRTSQPNSESVLAAGADHLSYFALLGRIAGFALYHRETIPAFWTTAFIKSAFGFPILPGDLASVDPELYEKKIVYLQQSIFSSRDGMKLEDLCLTFDAQHYFDEYSAKRKKLETVDLKPGGSEIDVTEENKAEYLQLFAQHRLLGGIKEQVQAFQRGLGVFFSTPLLARLRRECTPTDIKLLLCGAPEIDVDDWQASATYEGEGAELDSQEVVWFWSVLRGMDKEA